MEISFRVHLGESPQVITNEELSQYAATVGLNLYAEGRYSWLFVLNLMLYERFYGINPFQVVDEIRALEGHYKASCTKPASEFRRPPLKGLWHKHFFSARFLAKNIMNQLAGGRLTALVEEICDPAISPVITEEMVKELSHRSTIEPFEQRAASNALTGEWIVFAKYEGKNFYLCLATHETDDERIYENIKVSCWPQFPFLH